MGMIGGENVQSSNILLLSVVTVTAINSICDDGRENDKQLERILNPFTVHNVRNFK